MIAAKQRIPALLMASFLVESRGLSMFVVCPSSLVTSSLPCPLALTPSRPTSTMVEEEQRRCELAHRRRGRRMGPLYNTMRTELVGAGGESPSVGEITKGVHGNPTRGVLDHVKAESGWREGDTFLFGFGALLATSVFTRRGVYPSANGRRKFVRCTAPGYLLTFRHKGGFATLDQWSPDDECTVTAEVHLSLPPPRDAHGVMLPLSREELSSIAATEGGYALKNIKVVPYGCEDAIDSLAFITSPWRRLREPVLPTPRYINLILEGANEKQLDPTYITWLEQFRGASPRHIASKHFARTPGDVAAAVLALAILLSLYLL